ncbi:hypothetical protein LRS06_17060 [Hymenobacter sp. J193]|uniref:hypothetical protein n=1 Tax=Hymenobacter sp. J193 TaxID=2898429 RepID=UPI002150C86E|nr:hypothetical protein [Hymenobacter sp. J193]MCR5889448.1 hypothetical protein [Hymenobacter sp. J193]
MKPVEVASVIERKLDKADEVDCDYLADILAEIKLDALQGLSYDPGQKWGIDRHSAPTSVLEYNLQSADRWLAKRRALLLKSIVLTGQLGSEYQKRNGEKNETMNQRSYSIRQRMQNAEQAYEEAKARFRSKDYTDWFEDIKLPNGEVRHHSFDDFIKPYCRRYPTMLGYIFSCIDNLEVAPVLDKHFPAFDKIDADYLDDALSEIEGIVGAYSFSTTSNDGIDYYNGYKNESEMFNASMEGQNTDNRFAPKVISNVARARKWAVTNPMIPVSSSPITDETNVHSKVVEPVLPALKPERNLANGELTSLEWLGNGADLAELFYRLAKAGFINLSQFRPPNGGNMTSLCKHICQLFQVGQTPEKNDAAAVALQKALAKFATDELEPGEVDEQALWRKPIERRPGNAKSARVAKVIPDNGQVGEL